MEYAYTTTTNLKSQPPQLKEKIHITTPSLLMVFYIVFIVADGRKQKTPAKHTCSSTSDLIRRDTNGLIH